MTLTELTRDILLSLIAKSGVREWDDSATREAMTLAAVEMAANIWTNTEGGYMALPDNILVQTGTAIVFADTTDHSPAANNNLGTRTDQIDLTSVADGAARQSAKVDLGATRAELYEVVAAIEIAATPTAGEVIEFWWAPSPNSSAAVANPGGVSGSDSAYAGYSSNMSAAIKQLQFIGDFVCTAQATGTVQIARVGAFRPKHRYGTLVVRNESGAALHSDAVEMSVLVSPLAGVVTD
jgi:hypothetical protein